MIERGKRFWKDNITHMIHGGLKEDTGLFRVDLEVASTDYSVFIYKVVNPIQSSLSSSLI